MAINPNTNFTAAAVLTAAQQNRFPRGVVAYNEVLTNSGSITAEAVQITSSSFTAVADRYYRITYFEPDIFGSSGSSQMQVRLRLTNVTGTVLQSTDEEYNNLQNRSMTTIGVVTFTAGSTVVVATLQFGTGTFAQRSSTKRAFLLVEDIGPA